MLLTGPPGTGKSTFALELACSLASKPLACTENGSRIADKKAKVLYVSAEETGNRLKDKAVANGWAATGNIFICSEPTNPPHKKFPPHGLVIRGKDTKVGPAAVSPENCGGLLVPRPPAPQPPPLQEISRCMLCQRHLGGLIDVLVLDSLNIYSPDPDGYRTKLEKFNEIQAKIAEPDTNRPNPRLIIVVVDTSDNQDEDLRYCEFCADILLRFGWEEKLGYTLRTFEIVKMRGQSHAWGKQRVKLYPHATDGDGNKCKYARGSESPYLSDKGGFFVFPSMHTYISHFSHSPAPIGANPDGKPLHFPYPVNGLDRQISESVPTFQGLPAGGCTAVIGPRGALKSHLAYYFLLAHASGQLTEQAVDNPPHRNCLLVSLSDDQESAIETLAQIAESQNMCGGTSGRDFVENLIKNDWLEILENDIGMISPEEFFHKIYVAVHRPRANRGAGQEPDHKWNGAGMAQIVIVAGLDQLEARFPLIAQESIFVPALIQFFRWNKVCSMIVSAVGESATPAGQSLYGLLPMSDLLLHLSPIDRHNPPPSYRWPHDFPRELWVDGSQQVTRVETRRVPGGQIGEKIGYLFRKVDNSFHYVR
jgi:KaiC/GvpD/RAD55 family RecA-like ATPase